MLPCILEGCTYTANTEHDLLIHLNQSHFSEDNSTSGALQEHRSHSNQAASPSRLSSTETIACSDQSHDKDISTSSTLQASYTVSSAPTTPSNGHADLANEGAKRPLPTSAPVDHTPCGSQNPPDSTHIDTSPSSPRLTTKRTSSPEPGQPLPKKHAAGQQYASTLVLIEVCRQLDQQMLNLYQPILNIPLSN